MSPAAVRAVFDHPVIQRCQLHKARNVTDRLPDRGRVDGRQAGAGRPRDQRAAGESELEAMAAELAKTHPGAAGSLPEGLAETVTILRLGVPPTLARTLRSTNAIWVDDRDLPGPLNQREALATAPWLCAAAPRVTWRAVLHDGADAYRISS